MNKIKYRMIYCIFIAFMLVIILFLIRPAHVILGQTLDDTSLLIVENETASSFTVWDIQKNQSIFSFSFELGDEDIIRKSYIRFRQDRAYSLVEDGPETPIWLPRNTRLFDVDLSTGEQSLVWDNPLIWDFILSPNGQKAWVIYDPPDTQNYHPSFNPSLGCVFDLQVYSCLNEYHLSLGFFIGFAWIDDNTLLVAEQETYFIMDATTLEKIELFELLPNVNETQSVVIANEDILFISTPEFPGKIIQLNLKTQATSMTSLPSNFTYFSSSPDLTKIIILPETSTSSEDRLFQIVSIETGTIIAEFSDEHPLWAEWIDNENILITVTNEEAQKKEVKVYNLPTQSASTLLDVDLSTRVFVVE